MKIKFSKVMAIVCALSVAFAGLTAFAAEGDVTTITTYDAYNGADAEITVTSNVTGAANKEITYYVSNGSKIVYINQKTADGTGATSFTFKAKQGDVLKATAKYGTDAATNAFAGTEFTFEEGVNRIENGTANVTSLSTGSVTYETFDDNGNAIVDKDDKAVTASGTAYKAIVRGNVIEYGVKVGDVCYPAAGCLDDGSYMVILNGVNVNGVKVYAYAKDASGAINEVEFK